MLTLGPCSNQGVLWWTDNFHSSSSFILGKLRSSNWRDRIASDTCLSMFHVDHHQETPSVWCHVVSQFGTWLFRHYTQCPVSCCSNMEDSGQRHRCQVLQHSLTTSIEAPVVITQMESAYLEYSSGSYNNEDEINRWLEILRLILTVCRF